MSVFGIINYSDDLYVRVVPKARYEPLAKVLRAWSLVAQTHMRQAAIKVGDLNNQMLSIGTEVDDEALKKQLSAAQQTAEVFSDFLDISNAIVDEVLYTTETEVLKDKKEGKVTVVCQCIDAKAKLQGVMVLRYSLQELNILHIKYLVSNPENYVSPLAPNGSVERVRGAGRALLQYAEDFLTYLQPSEENGAVKEVQVVPLMQSISFYEKMGFQGKDGEPLMYMYKRVGGDPSSALQAAASDS